MEKPRRSSRRMAIRSSVAKRRNPRTRGWKENAAVDATMLIITVVFWIIIATIIGGVVLLRPVSKKLGTFLDARRVRGGV